MMNRKEKLKLLEKIIKQSDYPTPEELYKKVNNKITQTEFETFFGFLLVNHHILLDKGDIVWIHGGEIVDKMLSDKKKWITV